MKKNAERMKQEIIEMMQELPDWQIEILAIFVRGLLK